MARSFTKQQAPPNSGTVIPAQAGMTVFCFSRKLKGNASIVLVFRKSNLDASIL